MISSTPSTPMLAFSSLRQADEPINRIDHVDTAKQAPPFDQEGLRVNVPSPKTIITADAGLNETNAAYNASTTSSPFSAAPTKSPRLPTPGLAPPPTFVSQLFYETIRKSRPPFSCPTPSSTGATRGANSSADIREGATPPLTPMSASHDETRGSDAPPSPSLDDSTGSIPGTHRPVRTGPQQRSFTRQSFPSPSFYPGRSAAPTEQSFTAPGPYTQHTVPNVGFMGQYISPQPRHSMTMQTSVPYPYSQPFAHPGIHAHDPSGLGLPFNPVPSHPPQINPGFNYQQQGPSSDNAPGDRETRPPQGYVAGPSSPFSTSPSPGQPSASSSQPSGQHMSHHAFPTLHFSPGPSAPHYHGYPAHSYAHASPGLYSYTPMAYPQPFYGHPSSPEDVSKGTWWYLPSGGNQQFDPPPYPGAYPLPGYQAPIQMNHPEFDAYPGPGPLGAASPTNAFLGSSGQPPPSMHMSPRESAFAPPSPVAPRPGPSTPNPIAPSSFVHATAPSPTIVKKRVPADATSTSPPANSRKSYHPNPPANRSEWVMWVGNVPSDATHDEIWRFFNQPAPSHPLPRGTSVIMTSRHVQPPPVTNDEDHVWGGVSSVFLISRSNCAFVNFDTEKHLDCAVQHFNGKPLRPKDPRCPRLVCRVRRRDDDLKAGVGGQRGMGLHTRWVADQKERGLKAKQLEQGEDDDQEDNIEEEERYGADGPPTSPSTYLAQSSSSDPSPPIPAVSPVDDMSPVPTSPVRDSSDRELPRHGSSGDRSFASTNSSFLAAHFPKRYFILKSLTQYDLNVSLERGVWATQPHNEGILDKAYRTSKDVYLIFGANKSGEFFGYARMAGPISPNERLEQAPWASRLSASSGSVHRSSTPPDAIEEEDESDRNFLSPGENRMVQQSPLPVTPGAESRLRNMTSGVAEKIFSAPNTAPPELHQGHRRLSRPEMPREVGTAPEPDKVLGYFDTPKELTEGSKSVPLTHVPLRNTRTTSEVAPERQSLAKDSDGVRRLDTYGGESDIRRVHGQSVDSPNARAARPLEQDDQNNAEDRSAEKSEGWGKEFKIEWIRTERLPFHRTRHLRNPWNHDREVKVSRDGTELEPNVGQQLLNEWDKPASQAESSPPTSPIRTRGGRGTVRATSASSGSLLTAIPSVTAQLSRIGPTGPMRGRGVGQS